MLLIAIPNNLMDRLRDNLKQEINFLAMVVEHSKLASIDGETTQKLLETKKQLLGDLESLS